MSKLGKILKVGCLSVVAVVLLALAGLAVYVCHVRRTSPPWPERIPGVRLEPSRPILREADVKPDNAYYYIRQLTNWQTTLNIPKDEMLAFQAHGYRPNSYPKLEAWLRTNTPALQLVAQAAAMTNCQVATVSFDTPTRYAHDVLSLGRMIGFRVQRSLFRQDWASVTNDISQTLRVGQHVSRGGPLLSFLVSVAVDVMITKAAREVALERQGPVPVVQALAQQFADAAKQTEPLAEVMRYEYVAGFGALNKIWNGRSWAYPHRSRATAATNDLVLHVMGSLPEQMRSHFRDVYSVLIAAAIDPAGKDRLITQLNSFTKGHTQPQFLFGEDPYGRIMVSLLLPSLNAGFEQDRAHITVLRGTQLFLALCAYRHEHGGQLPKKLEDLVPAYLPKLPADPFAPAGQTFRYRVEKDRWLIWSLGPNQKDDGGQFNWQDPDDREHHEAQCDLIFASDEFEKARARARAQLEKQQQEKAAAAKP